MIKSKILFSILLLTFSMLMANPTAVPTFHCIGLYWSPANGASDITCNIDYRISGVPTWNQGYPLWFDSADQQYRGSIVHLRPGIDYEIRLSLEGTATTATLTASTWSEEFPIAKTVALPALSDTTLVVDESGTAQGYVLYTHDQGGSSTIDVDHQENYCITITGNASYIIIRNLVMKNASQHCIRLYNGAHDIVIEECDFSGWGTNESDGWGINYQSAVYSSSSPDIKRVIIQRNRMHHPASDANHWDEYRVDHNTYHPRGPQAISLFNTGGNHVFRYNMAYSDKDHYFNDIFGAGSNYSVEGFPNKDSDIYGNYLANCWDDGIEAEGANRNVRIWNNYIEWTYVKIAIAATSIGPCYIWRNVGGVAQRDDLHDWNAVGRGGFLKTSDGAHIREPINFRGKVYVFHNTILQPEQPLGVDYPLGCSPGLGHGGPMLNTMTRNNILYIYKNWHDCISDNNDDPLSDYDYDLYNGDIEAKAGSEPNGIKDVPVYNPDPAMDTTAGTGVFTLAPSSPGYDDGIRLPNFNDNYTGNGPDMGAHEAGSPLMRFGLKAFEDSTYVRSIENVLSCNSFRMISLFPNPFTPFVKMIYQVSRTSSLTIAVYNIHGKLITTLFKGNANKGVYVVTWDGKLYNQTSLGKGIYFIRVTLDKNIIAKKIVKLK